MYSSSSSSKVLLVWLFSVTASAAFVSTPSNLVASRRACTSRLQMAEKPPAADFEFQELKVQMKAMDKEGIPSRDLMPEKRLELEGYIQQVLENRNSPVPLEEIGNFLPKSRWRLGFSTEGATLGDLPRDATVVLEFKDGNTVDYVLQFSEKTMGLNRLAAQSTWTVDSGPVNPGLVTFVYQDIVTDVFGFRGLPVGFFGLLKGRANYVETRYFDKSIWIERGYSPEGNPYYNVYVRQDE